MPVKIFDVSSCLFQVMGLKNTPLANGLGQGPNMVFQSFFSFLDVDNRYIRHDDTFIFNISGNIRAISETP
jgi:hypothetical protein